MSLARLLNIKYNWQLTDLDQSYCLTKTLKATITVCWWQFYATVRRMQPNVDISSYKNKNTWEQLYLIKIWFWMENHLWIIVITIVMYCNVIFVKITFSPTHTHIHTLAEAKRLSLCQPSVHLRTTESHATVSHKPHLIHYDYRLKYLDWNR